MHSPEFGSQSSEPTPDEVALAALFVLLIRQNQQLRHDATHDQLTGLLNKRGLEGLLGQDTPPRAMLYVDGTNQKAVNDHLGHERGDEAIKGTAGILKSCLRPGDIAARVGGDEFLVLLDTERRHGDEDLEPEEILAPVTSRLHKRTRNFLAENPDLREIGFDIAVGGTVWQDHMSIDTMREASERNMYQHKEVQHEARGQHR